MAASTEDAPIARFRAYAAAFEAAYESDDWSLLEPYFTVDATSELNGVRVDGRAAVLASFRDAVAMFDRRFDSRRMCIKDEPVMEDGRVHFVAAVRYERAGLAPLEVVGEEWFTFEGDRIKHHVDRIVNMAEVMEYVTHHAESLEPVNPQ